MSATCCLDDVQRVVAVIRIRQEATDNSSNLTDIGASRKALDGTVSTSRHVTSRRIGSATPSQKVELNQEEALESNHRRKSALRDEGFSR